MKITHDIYKARIAKELALLILLDFQKAFDSVNIHILLCKLDYYGIRGRILSWFKAFLTDRKQFTCINGINSDDKINNYGVPQRTILGPLLFLL